MTRAVGNLERFSTVRHHAGIYRCVVSTARYVTSTSPENLETTIQAALTKVILQHPALCCGIVDDDKNESSFVRLESIDLSRCIEHKPLEALVMGEHEEGLIRILETRHSETFPDVDRIPPWRLIIVQSPALKSDGGVKFDVVFAFHHAIGDGMSGVVFHRSLLSALETIATTAPPSILVNIPTSTTLSPAVENRINFKISWLFLLAQLWKQVKPRWLFPDPLPPWTSTPISAANIARYISRVKILYLPPQTVKQVLSVCRKERATLTGLLHGLAVASFSTHVPEAQSFSSSTPYSLRGLSGMSTTDEMGVQVSGLPSAYSPELVMCIRSSKTPEQLSKRIWTIARDFRAEMSVEIAKLPNDNQIGLIPYISDLKGFFTEQIGKPRESTYEVSNVGVLRQKDEGGTWNIERLCFTQSGMGTGAAVGINVASVTGGDLAVSFTWLQGDIEERLVHEVMEDVRFGLGCVSEGKDVSAGPWEVRR
ncbi:alcohol acetyltransferase [Amylocarpus encephaloides]|uniref:Alcohol acetyltransferase n=1 Tax=Amylocarpus encephaloides TaxID=45428 RepID=A0A9P8C7L7_9HELO|nr:alcohol acetyltransferase [Amylocarpus encephaloides]